jgi:DNA-binding IclR family transcriptional regulator
MFGFNALREQQNVRDLAILRALNHSHAQGTTIQGLARHTGYTISQIETSLRNLQAGDKSLVRGRVRRKRTNPRWYITSAGRERLDANR